MLRAEKILPRSFRVSKNRKKKGGAPKSLSPYFLVNERDYYINKSFA